MTWIRSVILGIAVSACTAQETLHLTYKILFNELIAVCYEITERTGTLCGQNVEFLNVKGSGTYNNNRVLKG